MWWFRKAKNQLEIQLEIQLGNQLGNHWDHAPPPPEATFLLTACCMCLWVKLCGLSFNQGFMKATLCKQPLQARIDDQNKDWSDHPLNGKGCMLWWVEKIILINCSSLEPFHQGLHASAFLKLCGGILRIILTADKPKPQPHQLQMQKDSIFGIDLLAHLGAFDTHCHTGP